MQLLGDISREFSKKRKAAKQEEFDVLTTK